ncbi:MAG: Eco57I restriction-modification methylase domain-containing protein, partial [Ferruginibacter sp.]
SKLRGDLFNLSQTKELFDAGNKKNKDTKKKIEQLSHEITKLETEIGEIKNNKIYENAFEWRFEFPEVLNGDGDFIGFDMVIGNPPYFSISKDQSLKVLNESFKTFDNTGDVYCLFYERGNQILKNNGILFYITSNKWMRANYGKKLRNYFTNNTNPAFLFDFGWYQVFENASVDSNLLSFTKSKNTNSVLAADADKDFDINFLEKYISKNAKTTSFPEDDYWSIKGKKYNDLKNKFKLLGKVLSNWDFKINYGIKTGLNDAFIIDEKTKQQLIESDPKNSEIIKQLLRGRDVEKYGYNFENIYLINAHNGVKELGINRINVLEEYPLVFAHLLQFKTIAEQRTDKGDQWYNLRNCAYLKEFEKEKLIWAETMRVHKTGDRSFPRFGFDDKGIFTDKTVFIGVGAHLKYLLAFLNSSVGKWLIMEYVGKLDTGGYMMQKIFLDKIPILVPTTEDENTIIKITDKILWNFQNNKDSLEYENEINQIIYQLYDLTEEEIKLVENNV